MHNVYIQIIDIYNYFYITEWFIISSIWGCGDTHKFGFHNHNCIQMYLVSIIQDIVA